MKKMRILMVTESFPPHAGGSGWSTYTLCKALQQRGHTILVAKIKGKETVYNGIDIVAITNTHDLKEVIASFHPDILHAQHMQSTTIAAGVGIPLVVTLRDYWPLSYKGTLFDNHAQKNYEKETYFQTLSCVFFENPWHIKLLSPVIACYLRIRTNRARAALQTANRIICVSEFVQKKMLNVVDQNKLRVIQNMVDLNDFARIAAKKLAPRSVVFVGKLVPPKGPQIIPEALRDLPRVTVYFIGEGPLEGDLHETCNAYKITAHFLHYLPNAEVLAYIKGADAFVMPSLWHEPLGRTLLEALAVGAKIVASATGGTPEVIEEGKSGLLYDGSAHDLRLKIRKFLEDDGTMKRACKRWGQQRAREGFSTSKVVVQFEKIYRGAVDDVPLLKPEVTKKQQTSIS